MIKSDEVARWIEETLLGCDYVMGVTQIDNGNRVRLTTYDGRQKVFLITVDELSDVTFQPPESD